MAIKKDLLPGGGEVGETSAKTHVLGRAIDRFHKLPLFKRIVITIVLLAFVVFVAGALYRALVPTKNTNSDQSVVDVCGSDAQLQKTAFADIETFNVQEMASVASQVKAKNNYERDPNCLYIVLQDSLMSGDVEQAQTLYSKVRIYDLQGHPVSPTLLGGQPLNTQQLEQRIEYYKQLREQSRKSPQLNTVPEGNQ